jgi:O-methyltransferase
VIDENAQDPDTVAIRALNDKLMADERVYLAMLKNSDGITIAYKK